MSDVPEGYKMSEVGVIPEEWEVKQFGDFAYLSKNYINPQHSKKSYPCIELEHLTQETGLLLGFVESKEQLSQKLIFSRGDVLFGKLRPYLKKFYFAEFDGVCTSEIWVIKPYNNVIGQFIFHLIQSNRFLETANQTSGTKMPRADWKIVSCTPFPLPPLPEQQAIASALSDVDALITALEQLITKKRNIKPGAMQQLLTGKKRLPGFSGAWEVLALKETTDCLDHLRVPLNDAQRSKMQGDYPYCGANGILDYVNDYIIDNDIILIAEDGGYFDEYSYRPIAYRMVGKCWVNNHAHILKAKEGFNQNFIFYSLVHKNILRFLASGTRAKLNKSEMYKIEIDIPEKKEQQVIAQILSDMDTEIEALEQKRDKYKAIKQGMMQELLTGERRLA